MTPVSVPTPQRIPPSIAEYATTELNLVEGYTSDSFFAKWGERPQWDEKAQIKPWFDSTVGNDPNKIVTYTVLDNSVPPNFVQLKMTAARAAVPNLYTPSVLHAWIPSPTKAIEVALDSGMELNPVPVDYLSTLSQAEGLNHTLGGSGVKSYQPDPGPGAFRIDYKDDHRQEYYFIDSNGHWQWVGFLLRTQFAQGIGYPGKWINVGGVWIYRFGKLPTPPHAGTGVVATPVRLLEANERFVVTDLGMAAMIERVPPSSV